MVVPPVIIHVQSGFSVTNHPFWGTPICGTPPHPSKKVGRLSWLNPHNVSAAYPHDIPMTAPLESPAE